MHAAARVIEAEVSARAALRRTKRDAERKKFSLIVDLANEPLGLRWLRGAATLALLCGTALALGPGLQPFASGPAEPASAAGEFRMNAMLSGGEFADTPAQPAGPPAWDPDQPSKPVIASTASEIRVQGAVTEGLYWSLREAGVPPDLAAEYLKALASRIDVGVDVAPFDRYDLVLAKASAQQPTQLLYVGLRRFQGGDVQLLRWTAGGRTDWFDADAGKPRSDGLMAPVAGRMTSGFGTRRHPILGFARMHSGIDFGARWGTPIVAAADGQVVGAGWAGGYGRQIRVAHNGGIVTTYSHMSGIAAEPGQPVRQGQVIGYVGSTGLSTGPHLHFEVLLGGRAVNPLAVRMKTAPVMSGPELQAFKGRLKELMAIGAKGA